MREPLSYEIAHGAALAALEAGRAEGHSVCAVVVNRSGVTKVLLSDDGVGLLGVETARRKAYTSAARIVDGSLYEEEDRLLPYDE